MKKTLYSDLERVKKMKDEDIDFTECPEMDEEFLRTAKIVVPQKKAVVTIRLDPDVLAWFKAQGKGYQTRINALLRAYMKAHQN